jgi:Flp pilus assembly protein TadD
MLRGDYDAAETYLTRAMEASPSYHRKAASNLARVQYLKQKTSG